MSEWMVPSGIISLKRNEHCMCTAPGPPGQQVCLWLPAGWWGAPWVGSVCLLPRAFPNLKSGMCGRGRDQ